MRAAGYVRVSTDEQAREGISLQNQKQRIEHYCRYIGFELTETIEDAGISGGKNKTRWSVLFLTVSEGSRIILNQMRMNSGSS